MVINKRKADMKATVTWGDIIAECGNYRDGFVAVFRRYEGQPTDEKDARGRVVKVTVNSFARHVGIGESTFHEWVTRPTPGRQARSSNKLGHDVRRAAEADTSAVVAGIMAAPEEKRDEIFHELKLRRAGIDTSKAGRKASGARVHEALEPVRRAIASTDVTLCVAALREATEHLREALSAGAVDDAAMAQITDAFEGFSITLAEARFTIST